MKRLATFIEVMKPRIADLDTYQNVFDVGSYSSIPHFLLNSIFTSVPGQREMRGCPCHLEMATVGFERNN
jgi:hypothetical protein